MDDEWDDDLCTLDDWDEDGEWRPKKKEPHPERIESRAVKSRQRNVMRRAMGEQAMNDVLDWHFEDGCAYHFISGGDVDFMTFMRAVVKQHRLDYALFSTWCMAMEDAEEVASRLARGLVKRADVYAGEIFIQHYAQIFDYLKDILPQYGGRLCMQRNHAKVMVAYWDGGACAITSSANINTNPRIEQTVITMDREVADFYKGFFDSLKPKNPWPIPWEPWRP